MFLHFNPSFYSQQLFRFNRRFFYNEPYVEELGLQIFVKMELKFSTFPVLDNAKMQFEKRIEYI
jgi:oligoendopeptidase F